MDWNEVLKRRKKDRRESTQFDINGKALKMKEKSSGQTEEERKLCLGRHFLEFENDLIK